MDRHVRFHSENADGFHDRHPRSFQAFVIFPVTGIRETYGNRVLKRVNVKGEKLIYMNETAGVRSVLRS